METIHTRIRQMRQQKGWTLQQLGDAVGVTAQAVKHWEDESNKVVPRAKRLEKIAEALGVNPVWLQFGSETLLPEHSPVAVQEDNQNPDTHHEIGFYNYKLSAGSGNFVWINNHKEDPLLFRQRWFAAKRLSPENLRGMYIRGDSMEPELKDWDTVLIDISDLDIADGEIYAFVFKEKFYIKRIRQTEDGLLLLSSNPDYEPMTVSFDNADKFQLLGRMVWRGG